MKEKLIMLLQVVAGTIIIAALAGSVGPIYDAVQAFIK